MSDLPNHEFVVVTSTCKSSLVVRTPSETANLLSMSEELLNSLWGANVSHENCFIFTTTCNERVRPGCCTHSMQMTTHCTNLLLLLYVPDLYLSVKSSNREQVAPAVLRPRYGSYLIKITQIHKFGYTCSVRVPNIN
jgi:hypothetical protein